MAILVEDLGEALDIRLAHHAVAVDARRLVHVEAADLHRRLVRGGRRGDEALEDGRERAQVPLVVELDGRRHEGVGDLLVHGDGALDELRQHLLDLAREDVEVAAHDVRVDRLEHLRLREGRRERAEVALHAVDDEEGAGGRVHRGDELRVVERFMRSVFRS